MIAAKAAKPSAAPMPASVPSALMAPSVPLGTLLRVVTRYVVWPYACAVWFRWVLLTASSMTGVECQKGSIEVVHTSEHGMPACLSHSTQWMRFKLHRSSWDPEHLQRLAFPISDETVSDSLLTKLATKPICHGAVVPENKAVMAQSIPASPDPHTLPCTGLIAIVTCPCCIQTSQLSNPCLDGASCIFNHSHTVLSTPACDLKTRI